MSTRNKAKVNVLSAAGSPIALPMSDNITHFLERKFKEQQDLFDLRLKESEDRILQRFSAFEADIANLRLELKSVTDKVNKVNKRCDYLEHELNNLMSTVSTVENNAVAADVVLLNIPNNINAVDAVNNIVGVLSGENFKIQKIFRTRSADNTDKSVPIIVKLDSANERIKLFRALAVFRKKLNRRYMLSDFGMVGNESVLIHECLSKLNKDLLQHALRLNRSKLLHSVFTMRGIVFVRKRPDSKAIKINSINTLNDIIGIVDNNISSV